MLLLLTLICPLLGSSQEPAPAFLGEPDADRVAALRSERIAKITKGKGGRSLAFKITLADGTRGYFKPKQTFSAAHWYSEVAAYYLDRALGLDRVPPTTGRIFEWSELEAAAGHDERVSEVGVAEDGTVKGAFIWWIPDPLKRVRMGRRWERWVRIQKSLPVTPYQRPVDYRADLNHRPGVREATDPSRPVAQAPDTEDRPAELSDLIVFDYLTQNVDRWGGRLHQRPFARTGWPFDLPGQWSGLLARRAAPRSDGGATEGTSAVSAVDHRGGANPGYREIFQAFADGSAGPGPE